VEVDSKMGVHLDCSTGVGVSRLEVIEGPSGRRRRTKAERARIAAESMMPGVTVADVARKHGTTDLPQLADLRLAQADTQRQPDIARERGGAACLRGTGC
jgi:transposase-like protein